MGIQWADVRAAANLLRPDLRLLRFVHEFGYVSTSTLAAMHDEGEPADAEAFRPAKLTSITYVEHKHGLLDARRGACPSSTTGSAGRLIETIS